MKSIIIISGEEWYTSYIKLSDWIYEITPFKEDWNGIHYLNDGTYELESGETITIKDKKIIYISE